MRSPLVHKVWVRRGRAPKLIEGRDLQTVLGDGPIDPARAVRIIEQVAAALHAAHKVGLVHRDVKPSNILLDENDFAYLIDFGIARGADETRLTKSGNAIGSFQYIAPERLGTRTEEDARADIYSLACVLYECLTGSPPFAVDTMAGLVAAHLNTPPPQPSTTQPNVPAQFDEVISTGMAKDPDQRYSTTKQLAAAARAALTTPDAAPPSRIEPTRPVLGAKVTSSAASVAPGNIQSAGYAPIAYGPDAGTRSWPSASPSRRRKNGILVGIAVGTASAIAIAIVILLARSSTTSTTAAAKTVSKSDVESQISQKMTDPHGNKPESVSCPDDLKASVGAKIDCEMKINNQTYGVNVTVTSIEGDTAKFDMVETLNKNDVAQEISDQLEQQFGHKPETVTCPDNLKGVTGATLRCTLTDRGETYGINVTVTGVEGGDVKFNFKVDDQPITTTSPAP